MTIGVKRRWADMPPINAWDNKHEHGFQVISTGFGNRLRVRTWRYPKSS